MAGALPIISVAVQAIGTVVSVVGAISQGQAQARAERTNAAIAERNAAIARQQAAADAQAQQKDAYRRIGAARAAYGASGLDIEGSPLDVLEESAANAELDRQNILYRGRLREIGYLDEASAAGARGSAAVTASYGKAGAALLIGAGTVGEKLGPLLSRSGSSGYNGGTATNPLTGLRVGGV